MLVKNAIFWPSEYSENDSVHTFTLQLTLDTRHSAGDEWYKETQDSLFECELSTHLLKFEHSCVQNTSNFASSVDQNSV